MSFLIKHKIKTRLFFSRSHISFITKSKQIFNQTLNCVLKFPPFKNISEENRK